MTEETLPAERKKARAVRLNSRRYAIINGVLYKKSFLKLFLQCVGPLQANYVLREIHEASCSMHAGPRSVVANAIRTGYYWPTMHKDARKVIRECKDCQVHRPVPRNPQQKLTLITSPWPFYKWGIDIAGPFLEGPGKVKFLIVAIDYFTKWIEAKPVATITDNQSKQKPWRRDKGTIGQKKQGLDRRNPARLIGMSKKREKAAIRVARSKAKMEKYYNFKVRNTSFKLGDLVYRNNDVSHAEDGGKLGPKWERPYEVTEALGKGAYKLRDRNGKLFPRTWNVCNLKKCYVHEIFRIDSESLNKVSVLVVLDLSKVANPLYSLRVKDLFKSKDLQVASEPFEGTLNKKTLFLYLRDFFVIQWQQRLAKKNELKARGTLLMALPDKHQLKFNIHKDAKSLMEALRRGLEAIKKQRKKKTDLEEQSLDDLFNNLKIYEAEVKGLSASSQNTQNIAFVSSNNTDITNESVSVVPSFSAASSKATVSTLPNVDSLSDVVIYSFFTSQSNSPQLDNEDLKQIDADDLEEMYLKWLNVTIAIEEAILSENADHQGTTGKEAPKRTVPVKVSTSNALVSRCDAVGGYDWSFQADEEPTNYALMAYISSGSSSSSGSDNENETVFKDDIKLLKLDVLLRDNALAELRKKFEKAKKERDELKLTLDKFQTSSKNLKLHSDKSVNSMPTSPVNDRYKIGEGYHDVAPLYTGTFMPLKPDLVFNDAPTTSESIANVVPVKSNTNKPSKEMSLRPDAPIIEDWTSDSEDEYEIECTLKKSMEDMLLLVGIQKVELKFNLFSVSQMYDKKNNVLFTNTECVVLSSDYKVPDENHVLLRVPRENNMYNVDLKNDVPSRDLTCLFAKATLDESNIWHRRLGHINFKTMNKLVKGNLVRGLPSKIFENNHTCVACKKGMQHRASYPLGKFDEKAYEGFLVGYSVNSKAFRVFNSRTKIVQETLHINFLENKPNVAGIGPKWLFDIDTLNKSMNYQPVVAGNQPNNHACIKENLDADKVGKENTFAQQYVLLPLWSTCSQDPQNTNDNAFDVKKNENDVHVSPSGSDKLKKHDDKDKRDNKGKSPVDLSIGVRDLRAEFEEFSINRTNMVNAASAHVTAVGPTPTNSTNNFNTASPFDTVVSPNFRIARESSFVDLSNYLDDPDMPALEDIVYSEDEEDVSVEADFFNLETNIYVTPRTRSMAMMVKEQGGLNQINDENFHTYLPKGKKAIGSKWVFRKKKDKKGIVIRNKARLVAQGHTQEEGIDYNEVFALVARIEAIRLFLAYASFMGFMVYQMDVKSAFLYGTIEEVYVCQPPGFEDPNYPDKVYKEVKALYGLHQVPIACDYARASLNRKSTIGGCQFLGCRLISWQCKKQTIVATSSTEVEYVVAASCCAQVLWIQNQLLDYGSKLDVLRPGRLCAQAQSGDDTLLMTLSENVNGFLAMYTPSDDLISTDFKQKGVVPEIVLHILEEFIFLLGRHALDNEIPRMDCTDSKVASIAHELKGHIPVRSNQDRSFSQFSFECLEGFNTLFGEKKWGIFFKKTGHQPGYF
nr:reverse transcriptase domain-containing protein [Tanacetum cinerariifolium]